MLVGTGGGGFHLQEEILVAGATNFRPSGFALGRFNADPEADLIGTVKRFDPVGGQEIDGAAYVFLGDDDGGLSSTVDGPWTVGPGAGAVAVGDFDADGRPDLATANSVTAASNTASVLLNTTPWPATLPDNLRVPRSRGQHGRGA